MATVARKRIGAHDYFYLQHTIRRGGRVAKREIYLGRTLPRDLDERKQRFQLDLFREQWLPRLDRIRQGFARAIRDAPATVLRKDLEDFAIRFTYNSQRIEGSTLSLRETADLLERGVTPSGKSIQDVKEAEEHKALFDRVLKHPKDLNRQIILQWHRDLFSATKPDLAGQFRRHGVRISGSQFTPPSPVEVEPLMREFFSWYERSRRSLHPVERAALVHLRFVTIHPFADGNGRMSRLLMNFVLNRARFPLLDIPYQGRGGYYRSLERSQTRDDELPFLRWFVRTYAKSHRRFLR